MRQHGLLSPKWKRSVILLQMLLLLSRTNHREASPLGDEEHHVNKFNAFSDAPPLSAPQFTDGWDERDREGFAY